MPLYDLTCECGVTRPDSLVRSPADLTCEKCGRTMEKLPPLPAAPVFGEGRSRESKYEHAKKQTERLTKRSRDYDRSKAGKAEREATIARLRAKGTIPKGWKA